MKYIIFFFLIVLGNPCIAQSVIEDNGKQGIIDDNGKVILPPIYDTVIYTPQYIENFFVVKQKDKYAYAYKVTHSYEPTVREGKFSYQKRDKLASPYWVISDFEYDTLDPLFNFERKTVTELFMKYKKDGMYGLIHIESKGESTSMAFTEIYHNELGKISAFPPIYNQIFFSDNSIFPVQKNDKFGFIFNEKSDCTDSFYVNNTEIKYDELPRHISYNKEDRTYTIRIRENQKYGLLKFDYDGCKPKYQIPCECKTEIKRAYKSFEVIPFSLYVCAENEENTMIIYNEENKRKIELPAIEKKEGVFNHLHTKNGNKYILIEYTNYKKENKDIDKLARLEDIYVVDIINEKMKYSFLGNENVSYETYIVNNMPLLMRKTKMNNGFAYDFFDIETEQILFSIPPSKKGHHYYFYTDYNCNKLRVMCLKKNVGCYDYETKIYTKRKCKKCE